MSAPKTDVERQARRHRPAMVALYLSIAAALLLLLVYLATAFFRAEAPDTPGEPDVAEDAAPAVPD